MLARPLASLRNAFALTIFLCAAPLHAQSSGFTPGDLYLYSPAIQGSSSTSGAILRIDPATGNSTMLVDLDSTLSAAQCIAYDPYRNRLVFNGVIAGIGGPTATWLVDGNGALQKLGYDGKPLRTFAPSGDGKIYLLDDSDNTAWIEYLDAANVRHPLLPDVGLDPFTINGNFGFDVRAMLYDPASHCLFIASYSAASVACTGGNPADVNVRRIPLDSAGTQVIGPVTCNQFAVDPSGPGEIPVGLTLGPNGQLLLVVDTNSNAQQSRMIAIDRTTLAMSPFAANGYAGAAATNAGTWSTTLGKAVILDTANDVLRAFGSGETGAGSVIVTTLPVSSAGGTGEVATLIEIPVDPCAGAFVAYGAGLAGSGGAVPSLAGGGCPEPGAAVSVTLSNVLGGAGGVFCIGFAPGAIPLLGGTFLIGGAVTAVPLTMPGSGFATLPGLLPNDVHLLGIDVYLQAVFADPGAVLGASLTNGAKMEIR